MAKLKEVPNAEVHWQLQNVWNVRDMANSRLKNLLDPDDLTAFATVSVLPNSYAWSTPDLTGWRALPDVSEEEKAEAMLMFNAIKERTLHRFPAQQVLINKVFTFPNDGFIYVRRLNGDHLEIKVTGWGFANFNRGKTGHITDVLEQKVLNEITVSFLIDGNPVPNREFDYIKEAQTESLVTDSTGIYSFGKIKAGRKLNIRDTKTSRQEIFEIMEDSSHFDIDVTEWLDVRFRATDDEQPVDGEVIEASYGSHTYQIPLSFGVGSVRVPYLEGEKFKASLRGETQDRYLRDDASNEFVFEFRTPVIERTQVTVSVRADGVPVINEPVILNTPAGELKLLTDTAGQARTEFDTPETVTEITASVRDRKDSKPSAAGEIRFEFNFDTPPVVPFKAMLKVVNNEDKPLGQYPVNIDLGDGSQTLSFLTDDDGRVGPFDVVSGNVMQVWDGNAPEHTEKFDLTPETVEYIFRLPYSNDDSLNDCTVRVIQRNKVPAMGSTCILTCGDNRILATLNNKGEMYFDHTDFPNGAEVTVDLYHPKRAFPPLKFTYDEKENEYEFIEVDGPQPWWKIAGEITLAVAILGGLYVYYLMLEGALSHIPNIFA